MSTFKNLRISTSQSNVVETATLSGTISNSIDQTSVPTNLIKTNNFSTINSSANINLSNSTVNFSGANVLNFPYSGTWNGNINQSGSNSANLNNTTFVNGATFSGLGSTFTNMNLIGGNGITIDNDALPDPITKNVDNNTTQSNLIIGGYLNVGSKTYYQSKTYNTKTSNQQTAYANISNLLNSKDLKWTIHIQITGSTKGDQRSQMCYSEYVVVKTGVQDDWKKFDDNSFTSDPRYLLPSTITLSMTEETIIIIQPETDSDDGETNYVVRTMFTCLNQTETPAPKYS